MNKLKLVVIGAGGHSTISHGSSLCELKKRCGEAIDLCAICDLDINKAKSYAEQFDFDRFYGSIDEMLDKETPDAIVAVTPVGCTAQIVSELLPRGIPLLVEKPAGRNSNEIAGLLELARTHKTPHMVSFNRRFIPAVTKANEWIKGNIKERPPKFMLARMVRNCRTEPVFVTETGVHLIDTVLHFMGKPLSVTSGRSGFVWNSQIRFSDGVIAQTIIAPQAGVTEETYEIVGQDYCVRIDISKCHVHIFDHGKEVLSWSAESSAENYDYRGGGFDETGYFIDHVCKKRQIGSPDLSDAYLAMLVAEAIHAENETKLDSKF